jgi:hypothetical protein
MCLSLIRLLQKVLQTFTMMKYGLSVLIDELRVTIHLSEKKGYFPLIDNKIVVFYTKLCTVFSLL